MPSGNSIEQFSRNRYITQQFTGWPKIGGQATIYRCYRPTNQETNYVMRVIPYSTQSHALALREISILKTIQHQCCIQLIDHWQHGDVVKQIFLKHQGDLTTLHLSNTNQRKRLNQMFCVFSQYEETLEYLHSHGIIHRDLKPANTLYDVDYNSNICIKICDFGCAKNYGINFRELIKSNNININFDIMNLLRQSQRILSKFSMSIYELQQLTGKVMPIRSDLLDIFSVRMIMIYLYDMRQFLRIFQYWRTNPNQCYAGLQAYLKSQLSSNDLLHNSEFVWMKQIMLDILNGVTWNTELHLTKRKIPKLKHNINMIRRYSPRNYKVNESIYEQIYDRWMKSYVRSCFVPWGDKIMDSIKRNPLAGKGWLDSVAEMIKKFTCLIVYGMLRKMGIDYALPIYPISIIKKNLNYK